MTGIFNHFRRVICQYKSRLIITGFLFSLRRFLITINYCLITITLSSDGTNHYRPAINHQSAVTKRLSREEGVRPSIFIKALLKLRVVIEGGLRLFTPAAEKAFGCPSVREDLRAFPQASLPGHRFYGIKNSVHEKQNFFSLKKTKRKPARGRRRWEDRAQPARKSPPRQAG
jgi:hypothetical protein